MSGATAGPERDAARLRRLVARYDAALDACDEPDASRVEEEADAIGRFLVASLRSLLADAGITDGPEQSHFLYSVLGPRLELEAEAYEVFCGALERDTSATLLERAIEEDASVPSVTDDPLALRRAGMARARKAALATVIATGSASDAQRLELARLVAADPTEPSARRASAEAELRFAEAADAIATETIEDLRAGGDLHEVIDMMAGSLAAGRPFCTGDGADHDPALCRAGQERALAALALQDLRPDPSSANYRQAYREATRRP